MKKVILSAFVALQCCLMTNAQSIKIHFTDGTSVTYETSRIEKITTGVTRSGYINGKWYLGNWKSGSTIIHFDGEEYLSFNGNQLVWAGRQDGSDDYTIDYTDNYNKIKLTKKRDNSVVYWTIVQYRGDLLIVSDGGADRYFYPSQDAARNASLEDDISDILSRAGGNTHSSQTPMGQHFENRHVTNDGDRAWLANANNEPDKVAGLSQWLYKGVNLYPFGDPRPADINQHAIGDCSLCSVLASLSYTAPGFIKSILHDNGNGTYTVDMYDPQGNRVQVTVNNRVLCDGNGNIGQLTGKNNQVTWATILEKAVMKWEKCYGVDGIEGIGTEFAAPLFTGCGDSFAFSAGSLSNNDWRRLINWAVKKGMVSIGGFNKGGMKCGQLESVTNHAFTFMLSRDSNSLFAMRNPWGVESVDGVLEIPDNRGIVECIDARIVYPGASQQYVINNMQPYYPPQWTPRESDLGISPRLLKIMDQLKDTTERW